MVRPLAPPVLWALQSVVDLTCARCVTSGWVPVTAPKTKATTLRFTDEDRALLDALAEKEDRSAGAILRLALRAYAAAQGVTAKPKPKRSRSTT